MKALPFMGTTLAPKCGLKNSPKNGLPLSAPLGRLLAPSADILVENFPKGCQKETQKGTPNAATFRVPEKVGKKEFATLFIML